MENKEKEIEKKFNEFVDGAIKSKNQRVNEKLKKYFEDGSIPRNEVTESFLEYFAAPDDSGYVTEQNDIAALKAMRFSDIINNDLLGEYDEFGAYRINENILAELVALEKKIDANTPNGLEARAFVGTKVFYFNLTPAKSLGDGKARSVLQLREQVSRIGGYYIDTITTNIATYEFEDDKFFFDRAKEVFHYKPYATDADAPTVVTPDEIDARFKFIAAMKNSSVNLLDNVEEAYFDRRLQILNDCPELAFILTEFNARKKKLEKFFLNSKQKFLYYNQLLSLIMEEYMDKISKSTAWTQLQVAAMKYYEFCGEVETRMRADPAAEAAKANVMTEVSENGKKSEKKAKFPRNVEPVGRDNVKKPARDKEKAKKEEKAKEKGKSGGGIARFPPYRDRGGNSRTEEPTVTPPVEEPSENHSRVDIDPAADSAYNNNAASETAEGIQGQTGAENGLGAEYRGGPFKGY